MNSVGSDECAPRPCTPPAQPQGQRARQRRWRPSTVTRRFQRTTSKSAECNIAACARISGLSADFRRADVAASARSTSAPKECASADSVGIFWRRATFHGGRGRWRANGISWARMDADSTAIGGLVGSTQTWKRSDPTVSRTIL